MAVILETLQLHLADDYRVERELGRGGMATVYFARDLRRQRDVAIKVLNPELAATIGADRFEREITLASRLDHPHILGFYESGNADGLLYYVMPFVKGESVRDRLNREGQLPVTEAVRIVLEVADALGMAHEQGIVHRDIKPENIMLLENGHALVADFGIARAATEGDAQKLTQTGMAVGTPVYMSPEQSTGEKVGPAADIYSLGCVLYEMLSGDPPFTGKNAMAIMARHAMDTVPSIRIIRQTVPDEVEEAIYAAMEKSPADRPRTTAEFAAIITTPMNETQMRRVDRMTMMRRIPTPVPVPPKVPLWKKPAAVRSALVAAVAIGVGIWQFAPQARQANAAGGLDPSRIAVLYFADETSGSEYGYLADGLTESLIASLTNVQGLDVVSRGGVEQFRGSTAPLDSIGKVLNAGTIVRGELVKEGDKLRVNVRLIDGESGVDFDRAKVEREGKDALTLRDSLASQVAQLIRTRVGREIKLRDQRDATRNEGAWALVQRAEAVRKRAESHLSDRSQANADFNSADSLLAIAEGLDSRWAEPVIMRGRVAYRRAYIDRTDPGVARRYIDISRGHIERGLLLSPQNPDALEVRGNLKFMTSIMNLVVDESAKQQLIDSARTDWEAATQANPLQAGAWASLSVAYYRVTGGTLLDVNNAAKKALEADAYLANAESIINRLFVSSYDLGKFEPDAVRWCDEGNRRLRCAVPRHVKCRRHCPGDVAHG